MKKILFFLLFLAVATGTQAQDRWLYWKYKDYDGGINFTVPRIAIGAGSLFAKHQDERKLIRRVHKVRTLVFENGSPLSERDLRKFNRKAKRRHLEEIITIRDGKTRVQVLAKDRRNALRKVVVFVNDPEDGFFMISLKGKFKINEINKLIKKYNKTDKKIKMPIEFDRA